MPAYRYLLCDLLTDEPLTALPLTSVTFERRISRPGAFTGTLVAPNAALVARAKIAHRNAGRSALWVYRDNELWWGGVLWTTVARQGARGAVELACQAATFDSYAHRRLLPEDRIYAAADQGVIVADLWRAIQADSRGNIGVETLDQPTGVLRDRSYFTGNLPYVGRLIEDLGDLVGGPEHTIETFLNADGLRRKRLKVAQRIGQTEPTTVFQRTQRGGGRLLGWSHTADAVGAGTTFTTRGDATLSGRLPANDLLTAGWPLLDVTLDQPMVTDGTELGDWAAALRAQRTGATRTHSFEVSVGETGWSPNRLGDAVRLKVADAWHDQPEDVDLTVRPVGVKVTPPNGDEPETVEFLFGDAA